MTPAEATSSKPLSNSEKLDRLRLIRSENVGPVTYRLLVGRYGTAAAALDALPDLARRGGRKKAVKVCPKSTAEAEMEALEKIGAQLVVLGEPHFPPLLAMVEDAPPVLSVRGHAHLLAKRTVALVGSRNCSLNGQRFAETTAAELGAGGLMVASGMARGIDTAAHTGALETGTVAVLAGGVDVVYPKENAALYEEIVERGAVISEMEPGTEPQARHFPRRNRIISGVARGVVVVEANARSGALITARMALEQGREVFAVPGWPTDPRSAGANELIRQGAILARSAGDILSTLDDLFGQAVFEPKTIDFIEETAAGTPQDQLEAARAAILESLAPTPVGVDEIVRRCQFSPSVVQTVLLELELAGRLERHPGNMVSLLD